MSGGGYAFGDDEAAARRLDELASLWAPLTEAFLAAHGPRRPALALDLGCGPGHTTRLVADVLQPARMLGLDASSGYVTRAAARYPELDFAVADLTQGLPEPAADVAYARFLLAHLPEPEHQAAAWVGGLAPGGTLLLEEGEGMHTGDPVCARYLELVTATLAAEGRTLFAGARLRTLDQGHGWRTRHQGWVELSGPAGRFAALFLPNLAQWGPRARTAGLADEAELAALRHGLSRLAADPGTGATLTARMRQVVLVRR